ncbi:glycosyltransferase [Microbacterium oryzae]|nr:glycosyltransferase [Microbacterium oryzae]MDN3311632.1 glycosyltransferase [Microbacterium oryzae]
MSPDGAYGGPLRVAVNQSKELIGRGHEVRLVAGASGFDRALPSEVEGVPARLFRAGPVLPGGGFGSFYAPSMQSWLRKNAAGFDVAHIHFARDFVVPLAAHAVRKARVPYVLQCHGMISPKTSPAFRLFDVAFVNRSLHDARAIFYLTPREKNDLLAMRTPSALLRPLVNGVPLAIPEALRAVEPSDTVEVLYLSRLHPRKRPELFAAAAQELVDVLKGKARFSIVGPDGGSRSKIESILYADPAPDSLTLEGAIPPADTLARILQCDVFVLPSIDEPFPMAVLEAMSLGKPVIVTSSCGLAPLIEEFQAGIVIDEHERSLVPAIKNLIEDPALRKRMGERARLAVRRHFSMEAIGDALVSSYTESTSE